MDSKKFPLTRKLLTAFKNYDNPNLTRKEKLNFIRRVAVEERERKEKGIPSIFES